jgi:hypothetical protein
VEITITYFKDLRACWNRIQQVQLREYKELGLDFSSLVPSTPETERSERAEEEKNRDVVTEQWARFVTEFHKDPEGSKRWPDPRLWDSHRPWMGRTSCTKVDIDQISARRGPPTDRPPGDPPPCIGASRGSLQERAGSRHLSQLASSHGTHSLSGNATPLESIQYRVYAPSNYPASSQAGSG